VNDCTGELKNICSRNGILIGMSDTFMEDDTDRKTIRELKSMALQYKNRGNLRKATDLLTLAERIEERLKRGQNIVEINKRQEDGGQRIG